MFAVYDLNASFDVGKVVAGSDDGFPFKLFVQFTTRISIRSEGSGEYKTVWKRRRKKCSIIFDEK